MSQIAAADSADIRPGTVVAERFTVQDTLGVGGAAVVYRAHDRVLDRQVALKLLGETASSHVDQSRFEREIRLTARLVHPSIVPLFDSGWHAGRLYYVMPCISGTTLRAVLATQGRMPPDQALRLAGDVAEALAYAHAMGFVHRDIKPENIFSANGRAVVADFGIAHSVSTESKQETLTTDGVSVGTVAYMSPEQALGERTLDGRADLYSLGCVLFELLSGEPPFRGPTAMSVLSQHLSAVPDVASRLADAPPAMVRLIERLLAKDPAGRPATAVALIELLHALTTGPSARASGARAASVTAPPAAAPTASPEAAEPRAETEVQRTLKEARRLFNQGVQGGPGTRDILALGRVLAEKSLALEPRNVGAMAVLADIITCQGFRGFADEQASFDDAQRIRMEAAAIDDSVGELQASIGVMRLYWSNDFHGAERYFARSVELAPDDGSAHRHYSSWLKMAGRFDEALAHVERAVALMPDSPHTYVGLADVLMSGGRYVEAIAPLQAALRLTPRYDQAMERLEMTCHRAGRTEDAYASRRTLLGTNKLFERLARLTETYEREGWEAARKQDLQAELEELVALAATEDPFKDRHTSRQLSDRIIITSGELGEWKRAMDWVERGYYVHPGRLIRVLTDLPFDRRGLASDPRYARLLRTAGLEGLL
jgi:tetratricopeptide (TPR) repeat protein